MSIPLAETIWMWVAFYLGVGLLVAVIMALFGAAATDHAARGANLWFRLMILPGAALLWPYMVGRLLSGWRVNAPTHEDTPTSEDRP